MQGIKKIKDNWYMSKFKEQTNNDKIQFVFNYRDIYIFAVSDWLTDEEIEKINLKDYSFMKWTEFEKEGVTNVNNN